MTTKDDGIQRSFETGATRDTNEGKLDFAGFLSPTVLHQFARYMNMNRLQSDGTLRSSSNWKKGIPMDVYMKSAFRHFFKWWNDDQYGSEDDIEFVAAICGLMFNTMGYLHEWLKNNDEVLFDEDEPTAEMQERIDMVEEMADVENADGEWSSLEEALAAIAMDVENDKTREDADVEILGIDVIVDYEHQDTGQWEIRVTDDTPDEEEETIWLCPSCGAGPNDFHELWCKNPVKSSCDNCVWGAQPFYKYPCDCCGDGKDYFEQKCPTMEK